MLDQLTHAIYPRSRQPLHGAILTFRTSFVIRTNRKRAQNSRERSAATDATTARPNARSGPVMGCVLWSGDSAGGAGDEGRDDVGGVAVERDSGSVVAHRGSRVGVAGGLLYVAERYAGIERGGD